MKFLFKTTILMFLIAQFPSSVRSEGLRIYGLSSLGQGRAEAVIASEDGPSASWYNPASLVQSNGNNFEVGLNNMWLYSQHTSVSGTTTKSEQKYFPLPALYFSAADPDNRFAFGVALNTPFGLASNYNDNAPFRYVTLGGEVSVINFNPSVAFRLVDGVSLAGGVVYYRSSAKFQQAVDWSAFGASDGKATIDGDGNGYGFNGAVLVQPNETTSIGLTYRSQVNVKYRGGSAVYENIPVAAQGFFGLPGATYTSGAKTSIRYPDMINLGVSKKMAKTVFEVGGMWTNWRDVESVDIKLTQPATPFGDVSTPFRWKNAWVVRAGFEHALSEKLAVSGGYFFDKSPTNEDTYTPLVPDGDHHVVSTGLSVKNGGLTFRLPLVVILQTGTSSIDSSIDNSVDGKYELIGYQVGLGLSYSFGS